MGEKITGEKKDSERVAVVLTWISLGCESWSSLHREITNAIFNIAQIPKRQVHWTPTGSLFSLRKVTASWCSCSPHTDKYLNHQNHFIFETSTLVFSTVVMDACCQSVTRKVPPDVSTGQKKKQSCNSAAGCKRRSLCSNHKRLWLQKAQRLS